MIKGVLAFMAQEGICLFVLLAFLYPLYSSHLTERQCLHALALPWCYWNWIVPCWMEL
jgi:hypothetical protein